MRTKSELLEMLLQKRGIQSEEKTEIFLSPSYERDFHDPFLMKDMKKACMRIFSAIEKKEKIIIYADYDCDGIPGATILSDFFDKVGYKNYEVYIPHRNEEGYGLYIDVIDQFSETGAKLIITVDLGTTAVKEIKHAKKKGVDVIITDHHIPPEKLPDAYAILNPKTDEYPEKMLAGAGVVFKIVQALVMLLEKEKVITGLQKLNSGWEKWMLDMAGLATISDMVPLAGENRAIAYFGMKVLRKSRRPGLQKLLQKIRVDQRYLSTDDVGYMITPKLNAASRMDNPMRAYELLSTKDEVQAGALADHLAKINDSRKTLVTSIMREINKNFAKREEAELEKNIIVVGNPKWRLGVLGLVAGRLSEEHECPVFVWGGDENDCIRGSCRSDGSVSLVELMTEAKDSFTEFGGHELAGGFSVDRDKIHFLEEALSGAFMKVKREKVEEDKKYDMKLSLSEVNMKNWRDIERLEPFGLGNPKPVFLFERVMVENIKKFGKNGGEHIEITFSEGNRKVKAISFFSGEDSFKNPLSLGAYINLLATFDLSRFRGRAELRLRVEDIV